MKLSNSSSKYFQCHFIYFFKDFLFLMWTIFKVFIEFVTISLLFYVLDFWPWGMWDLSSLTRDLTLTHCIGRGSLKPPGKGLPGKSLQCHFKCSRSIKRESFTCIFIQYIWKQILRKHKKKTINESPYDYWWKCHSEMLANTTQECIKERVNPTT